MNKLLLALLLISNVAMADDWESVNRMLNDNIRTRTYSNPPVYIPPPVYIAPPAYNYNQVIPPAYIPPIQGNPNAGSYNFYNAPAR